MREHDDSKKVAKSAIRTLWAGGMNQPVRIRFEQIEEQIKDGKVEKGSVAQDKQER
jgi:predicted solute-binding protein